MAVYTAPPTLPKLDEFYTTHKAILDRAVQAMHEKTFHAQYPEHPKAYAADGMQTGQAAYEAQLNQPFTRLKQQGEPTHRGEISPYTQEPLGIQYPSLSDPAAYVTNAQESLAAWRETSPEQRAGLLIESLERMKEHFYEIAFATQHTTGQGFMMSFQASGPHAADRALEAVALGYDELTRQPREVVWEKPMGKFVAKMNKYYKPVPKGVALAIGVSTFPIWNSVPGIYASLITGNPVIIKPHPGAIYPLAIVAGLLQETLADAGLPTEIVQLATDTVDAPLTKHLAEHPLVKVIDFTGGNAFGDYIETLPGKVTFTEKAGVNSVIIDSTTDLQKMAQNLAFSVSLYSGQMCTCPQNFFVPKDGIDVNGEKKSFAEVAQALAGAIQGLVGNEKAGPAVGGAIQNPATAKRAKATESKGKKVWLESQPIANPEFPKALTASPGLVEVGPEQRDLFGEETFGPVLYIIPTENTLHSLTLARELAQRKVPSRARPTPPTPRPWSKSPKAWPKPPPA